MKERFFFPGVSSKKKKIPQTIWSQSESCFVHGQKKQLCDLQMWFLSTPRVIYVFLPYSCTFVSICLPVFICIVCLYKRAHQIQGLEVVCYLCATVFFYLVPSSSTNACSFNFHLEPCFQQPLSSGLQPPHPVPPECQWVLRTTGWMCLIFPEHQFSSDMRRRRCY